MLRCTVCGESTIHYVVGTAQLQQGYNCARVVLVTALQRTRILARS